MPTKVGKSDYRKVSFVGYFGMRFLINAAISFVVFWILFNTFFVKIF